MIVSLIIIVFCLVGRYYIFEKKGEYGWKALIPIYSNYIYGKFSKCRVISIIWGIMKWTTIILAIILTYILITSYLLYGINNVAQAIGLEEMRESNILFDDHENTILVLIIPFVIATISSFIITLILRMIVYIKFSKIEELSRWYILWWLIAPHIVEASLGLGDTLDNTYLKD